MTTTETTPSPTEMLANQFPTSEEYATLRYIGGRKFAVTVLVVILTFVLTWFKKIEPGIFSVVIVTLVCAYIAGNVTQKINTGS